MPCKTDINPSLTYRVVRRDSGLEACRTSHKLVRTRCRNALGRDQHAQDVMKDMHPRKLKQNTLSKQLLVAPHPRTLRNAEWDAASESSLVRAALAFATLAVFMCDGWPRSGCRWHCGKHRRAPRDPSASKSGAGRAHSTYKLMPKQHMELRAVV